MLCALAFVGFHHGWVGGSSSLWKLCYYDCTPMGKGTNGSWYDRVYRISPLELCPKEFEET
jgi:hypothetical protein